MKWVKSVYVFSTLFIFLGVLRPAILRGQTCTSDQDGTWLTASTWSCASAPSPPNGAWRPPDGQYIVIEHAVDIADNLTVNLSSSDLVELRITGTGSLIFGSNAKLLLPTGATIVMEDGATLSTTVDDSGATLIQIGGNGIWGNGCTSCNDDELTGPGSIDENSDPGSPLPVELTSFRAYAIDGKVVLEWTTASEENNDYFILERAGDDRQFTGIARIEGHGTTSTPVEYRIEDNNPPAGQLYYRLKQIDFDGSEHFHPAVGVQFQHSTNLLVFPNPSINGQFQCRTSDLIEGAEYVDMTGVLHRGEVIYTNNMATISPTNTLKKGYYVVRLLTGRHIHLVEILIQ